MVVTVIQSVSLSARSHAGKSSSSTCKQTCRNLISALTTPSVTCQTFGEKNQDSILVPLFCHPLTLSSQQTRYPTRAPLDHVETRGKPMRSDAVQHRQPSQGHFQPNHVACSLTHLAHISSLCLSVSLCARSPFLCFFFFSFPDPTPLVMKSHLHAHQRPLDWITPPPRWPTTVPSQTTPLPRVSLRLALCHSSAKPWALCPRYP